MLPIQRLISTNKNDDRLIVAISQHDLNTVRYLLESNRYRSTINQSVFFNLCRADFNHPITLLGSSNKPMNRVLFLKKIFLYNNQL